MANRKNTNSALSENQTTPGTQVKGGIGNGGNQPPMNRMYGAEPYSTMKPATSSDSASTRSNGVRLVSASAEMKKMTNIGNSGSQNQLNSPKRPFCASTMAVRLSDPTHNSTVIMTKPIETS